MGEHAPGVIKMLADVATGGSTKELFKQMEAGKLDPNILLPKLAAEMEKKAAQGEKRWRGSSVFQQGLSEKRLEDQLKMFAGSGGQSGFLKIWTTFAETLPKMAPLFRAAGQAFDFFAGKFQGLGDIIGALSAIVGQVQGITYATEDMSNRLGQLAPFLAAFWKRAFAPLYGAYLIIQDIAGYSMGMKSVTGMAFDFMQNKGQFAPKNPTGAANPYEGKPFGGTVFQYTKEGGSSGSIADKGRFAFWRTASALYSPYVDLGEMLFTPNRDTNQMRINPEAVVNNMAYGGTGGNKSPMSNPIFNLTFNGVSGDHQDLANIVTKTISSQTIPFLLRNNGE